MMSEHGGYSTTTLAADRKRWTLEEKLPHAFLKLEEKAAKDDERRQERLRREELRRDEWEAAMARARLEYFAQKRHEWLEEQLAQWCRVRDMREFVAAAGQRSNLSEDDREWLIWVEGQILETDPARSELAPVDPPEPEASDLQPFLRGRRPFGPDHGFW